MVTLPVDKAKLARGVKEMLDKSRNTEEPGESGDSGADTKPLIEELSPLESEPTNEV